MNIKIQFSEKFSNYIEKFKDNKVIKVLISLRDNGIAKENLMPNDTYVDFINIKEDQSISYIKVASIVVASSKISKVPKGSIGTVVHVYENKDAYEVEFIVNDSSVVETVSINQIDEKQ